MHEKKCYVFCLLNALGYNYIDLNFPVQNYPQTLINYLGYSDNFRYWGTCFYVYTRVYVYGVVIFGGGGSYKTFSLLKMTFFLHMKQQQQIPEDSREKSFANNNWHLCNFDLKTKLWRMLWFNHIIMMGFVWCFFFKDGVPVHLINGRFLLNSIFTAYCFRHLKAKIRFLDKKTHTNTLSFTVWVGKIR